jgi:tRNA (guanine37-N1)-methyltransferase
LNGNYVIANDLNPDCFRYLEENVKLNKVEEKVERFNMDARDFVKMVINYGWQKGGYLFKDRKELNVFTHVYMNLPGDAVLFLDVFNGFLLRADNTIWNCSNLPVIHVYTFSEGDSMIAAKQLVMDRVKCVLPLFHIDDIILFHEIRDISTNKKMYCLSF